jgi:hypothetical protein
MIQQVTTGALIDACQNEPFLHASQRNASNEKN